MFTEDKAQKIKEDSRSLVSGHEDFFEKLQLESIITVFSLSSIYVIPYLTVKYTVFEIPNEILLSIFVLIAPFALLASHYYSFYLYDSFSRLHFGKNLLTGKECRQLWSKNIKNFLLIDLEILYRIGLNTLLTMALTYLALFTIGFVFGLNPTGGFNYLFLTISFLIGLIVFVISRVSYTFSTAIFIDSLNNEETMSPKAVAAASEKCVKSIGSIEIIKFYFERPISFMRYRSGSYLYLLYRLLISSVS